MARRASVAHPCTGRQATHTPSAARARRALLLSADARSNSVLSERFLAHPPADDAFALEARERRAVNELGRHAGFDCLDNAGMLGKSLS